jgi:hypothetical protein
MWGKEEAQRLVRELSKFAQKKNSPSERSAHAGAAKCKGTSMSRSYTTINNVYGDRSFLTQAGLPLMIGRGVLVGPIEAQLRRLEPAQGRLKSQEVRVGNSWVRVGKTHSAASDPHLLELSSQVAWICDDEQRPRRPDRSSR